MRIRRAVFLMLSACCLATCSIQEQTFTPLDDAGVDSAPDGAGSGRFAQEAALVPDSLDAPYRSVVRLTATARAGATFAGWSGDCTGAGACEVAMDRARHVVARFASVPAALDAPPVPDASAGPVFSAATASGETGPQRLTVITTGAGRVSAEIRE